MDDVKSMVIIAISNAGIEKRIVEQLLEIPNDLKLGDFALPCFKLAVHFSKNPIEIAKELSGKIVLPKGFSKVEARGPYINFFLDEELKATSVIKEILAKKKSYGSTLYKDRAKNANKSKKHNGKVQAINEGFMNEKNGKTIIEYCQANPMKAFHIGHVRNIVLGESIALLLESQGIKVFRMNYGGDVGPHVSKTLYAYRELAHDPEPKGIIEKGKWLGKLYRTGALAVKENPELESKMREMVIFLEKKTDKSLVADWKKLRNTSMNYFNNIFRELGTKFDRIVLESEVEKDGIEIAKDLLSKKIAIKDHGAVLINLEEYKLGKFLILKSDGAALYSSKDLALAKLKKKEIKAKVSYNLVGSEQNLYFRQLTKTISILNQINPEYCPTEHISYELVRLEEGKMASREGNVITYSELMDEVYLKAFTETLQRHPKWPKAKIEKIAKTIALAGIKFGMLSHDRNSIITFNWKKATSLEGETGPFIIYSYARAKSILRKAGKFRPPKKFLFSHPKEKEIVALLVEYPNKVRDAAESFSPHKISFFLISLSQQFNSFYQEVRIIGGEPDMMKARLCLTKSVAQVLENGLALLNIRPIDEM